MRPSPDVLVIGGGVIGCAIAHALARGGASVLLVDRGALGGEASGAAAGVLAVAGGGDEGPRLALRRASRALFPALAAALREDTGIDVELVEDGMLEVLLDDADEAAASARLAHRRVQGFPVERLDAAALRAAEPAVHPAARGALFFPDDGRVTSERLVAALAAAARRRGAELIAGLEVHGVERAGERIARVRAGAQWVTPGTVVLAAGAWAARVPGVAPGLGVEPVRGQMLALRPAAPLCRHVLARGEAYLVPTPRGEVLVGSTADAAGFARGVTLAGLARLAGHAAALAPSSSAAPVLRTWSGLRPHVPAGGPPIGRPCPPRTCSWPAAITATACCSRRSRRPRWRRWSRGGRRRST